MTTMADLLTKQKALSEQSVQQRVKKQPRVDKEYPNVKLYCSDYMNHGSAPSESYVFNGDKLFFKGYPYSIELSQSNCESLKFDKCKFFEAHEGTLIRVFNINDKWYTTTNRCLDAFESKWAAKKSSFGLHFAEAVKENIRSVNDEEFFEEEEELLEDKKESGKNYLKDIYERNLDKSKKYMFLLEPCSEERIVCLTNAPKFYNIGVFDENNNLSLEEDIILADFKVPKPIELKFQNKEEMLSELSKIDIMKLQGFIAIQSEDGKEDKHFKIFNDEYKYLFSQVRGNVPSIRFRFLQLDYQNTMNYLNNNSNTRETQKVLFDFCRLYNFDPSPLLDYIWARVVEDLFRKYINRYVKKIPDLSITNRQETMLHLIHQQYQNSHLHGRPCVTDKRRIRDILAIQKPSILNQLIIEYEAKDKKERAAKE
jgi:hypothetical protein